MERVLGQLSPVNVDLNDTAGLVANPYNAIEFESFEAGRELDGATVKQALEDTEAFVRDFLQRFEDGGEFAGGLEVSQEEYRARYREAREELKAREEEARESIQEKRAEVQEELKRENQRLREELEKLKKEKEQERERLEKEKLEELKEQGLQENDSRVAEELAGIRTMMEKKFEKQRKHYEKMLARYRAQLQKEIEELKKRKKEEYDELRQYLMQELDHLKKGRKPAGKTLIDYRTGKDDKALKEIEEVRKDIWNFEEELLHLMMERFQEAFGGSWERHLENYRIMDKIMERRNKENRDREHEGNPYNLLEVASLGEKLDIIGKKKFWEPLFSHVFRYLGEDPKSTRDFFNKHSRELTSLRNDLYHPRLTVDQGKLRIGRAAMERLWDSLKRYRHEKQASRTN
jgi:DNA repair exonuclease SbcCD ATPase subunit